MHFVKVGVTPCFLFFVSRRREFADSQELQSDPVLSDVPVSRRSASVAHPIKPQAVLALLDSDSLFGGYACSHHTAPWNLSVCLPTGITRQFRVIQAA